MPKPLSFSPVALTASLLVAIVFVVLMVLWLPDALRYKKLAQVTFPDGFALIAEVADTPVLRAKGLSGRRTLKPDEGMLFLFDEHSVQSFWMPNMKFPIDIIWIDENTVVSVGADAQPEPGIPVLRYSPEAPVNRVLEVPAGTAKAHGLKPGDKLDIQTEET